MSQMLFSEFGHADQRGGVPGRLGAAGSSPPARRQPVTGDGEATDENQAGQDRADK